MKTTVLGLGIMGTGVARNLQAKGMLHAVYNRTADRAEPFRTPGVRVAATPREAAAGAEVVIAVVGDDDASEAVWFGEDGALAGMAEGMVGIEFSTLSPEWVRELGAAAAGRELHFLDAPMTGTKPQAEGGQLRLFIGGDAAVLDRVRPVLAVVSTEQFHLGPLGAGATWKLVNNMMAAVHAAALAEGLVFAERAGLDMEMVGKLVPVSTTASPMVMGKLSRMLSHNYTDTHFSLKWMAKDVRYALRVADELNVPLRTVEAAADLLSMAIDKGFGEQDVASVVEGLRD